MKTKLPDFGRRISSVGVRVVPSRDLKRMTIGMLTNKKLGRIHYARRKTNDIEFVKNPVDGTVERTIPRGSRMMQGVDKLFSEAEAFINKVSMGEVKRRELKNPHLRALFSSDKIREMNSYLVSRLMYKANKRQLLQYVRKAEKHTISLGDIKKVARLVGKSEAAKFLIEYNDRLALAGEKQKQLFENPKVKRLRKHIYEINKQLKDYRSALSLFKSLDKRKFISERAFLMALREAGPSVMGWFKELDWRKKPFIVQYAVGENELIKNPYGNGDENITSTFPLDRCRNDVVDSIKLLGRDIAMERFRIKTACIDE